MGLFSSPDDPTLTAAERRQIMGDSAETFLNYWPQMNTAYANEIPKMADAELGRQQIMMEGVGDQPGMLALLERNQPVYDRINATAREAGVATDAHLVEQYTGRFGQVEKDANREMYEALDRQDKKSGLSGLLAQQGIGNMSVIPQIDAGYANMNAPLHEIFQGAASAVKGGGALNADQRRVAQQDARQGSEARGMFRSNKSFADELFSTDAARKRQQLFDQNTMGMAGGMINQNVASNMSARSSLIRDAGSIDSQLFNQGQARIANRANTRFDPIQMVLGRQGFPGMSPGQGAGITQQAASAGQHAGMPLFDQYMTQAGANVGMAQSGRNAYESAKSDYNSGLMGLVGDVAGASIPFFF